MVDFDVQMISHVIEVQTKPKTFGEEPIDGIMAVTNEGMTTYSKMEVQVGTLMQFHRYTSHLSYDTIERNGDLASN